MTRITDADLDALNARDFAGEGCAFVDLTARQLARRHGLARVYSGELVKGGCGGRLLGYRRAGDNAPCTESGVKGAQNGDAPCTNERGR